MKIPIYQQLELIEDDLKKTLKKSRVGKMPLYIDVSTRSEQDVALLAKEILGILANMGIDPCFPYPLYLVGHSKDFGLPFSRTKADLPAFYNRRLKRLKNKEQALLGKVTVQAEKLSNMHVSDILKDVGPHVGAARRVKELGRQLAFVEHIRQELAAVRRRNLEKQQEEDES